LGWQVANQSLNVGINFSNANKSTPLPTSTVVKSYFTAVTASCGVALGLNALVPRLKSLSPNAKMVAGRLVPFAAVASAGVLNVFLMRGEEIRQGIDVFPVLTEEEKHKVEAGELEVKSLGRSKKAATLAVGETAVSRVLNATPIMVLPPLILVRLQKTDWLKQRPRMVTPINLGESCRDTWEGRRKLTPEQDSFSRHPFSHFHSRWLHSRSDRLSARRHWRLNFKDTVVKTTWWSLTVGYDGAVSGAEGVRPAALLDFVFAPPYSFIQPDLIGQRDRFIDMFGVSISRD
jgi:hypothetical protein